MKHYITSISCHITEDNFENGMDVNTFHSYAYAINEIANNKQQFIDKISNYIGKNITEENLDIIDNSVNVYTHVAFKPNQDWDEFPIATDQEIALWKEGKMKLYVAEYSFICYNLADEFELK